ncbi:replication factor A protein 1-like [Brassica rapa]|uniref:replication factor A protein 1-like n=1 Tax=Brassica campestris TaxID=3711 RepID=UPI00142E5CC4|nr:replication factor A protein 1-like [Brassica rapa]
MSIISKKNNSFVLVKNIDSADETQKIKVKVLVLWKTYKSSGNTHEMVLIDEEACGTRIHAQVEEDLMKKHLTVLKEGEAVSINTFQLKDYLGEFRTNPYPYKITFFRTTKVKAADDFLEYYPEKYFSDFENILSGKLDKNVLVDVIGQIVNIGPMEQIKTKGKDNSKLDIILRDTMNVHLTCTLWSDFAKKVMDYTKENNTTIVICVIKFACIKEYKGNISISNAFNSTQIFLNPETAEVKTFTAMLSGDNQLVTHSDSKVSFGSAVSLHDEMLVINPRKTISGILDSRSVGTCVVVAKIDSVDLSKKWYYVACELCKKKVQPYGDDSDDDDDGLQHKPRYNCPKHNDIEDVIYNYFLILRVSDESEAITKFLLFDGTANKLIARPALELVEEAAESPIVKFSDHEWEAAEEFSRTPSSRRREETSSLMSVEDQGSSTKKQKMMQVKVEQRKKK